MNVKQFEFRSPSVGKDRSWYDVWIERSKWCNATYGQGNWKFYNYRFLFRSEKDLMLYLLRWL